MYSEPRPRKAHLGERSYLDRLVEDFLWELGEEGFYPHFLVYEEDSYVYRRRYSEKYRGGYFNVKVSSETLELLRERKRAARRLLGGIDVYDVREGRKYGSTAWRARHSYAYFHKDFVENTYILEKHLSRRLVRELERYPGCGAGRVGRTGITTSLGLGLRDELTAWRDSYGYKSLDHLLYTILVKGEEEYRDFLKELGGYVEGELRMLFGLGRRGLRKFVTWDAEGFLKKYYG